MTKATYQSNYWHYLTGDFFNRIHALLRKVLSTLTRRISGMFNYAGVKPDKLLAIAERFKLL